MSEVGRLLAQLEPLLLDARANGRVGDAAVHALKTLLETVPRDQQVAKAPQRIRLIVEIEVDEETVPGFGHDPQDFAEAAAKAAIRPLGCYSPKIVTTGWGPADQAG